MARFDDARDGRPPSVGATFYCKCADHPGCTERLVNLGREGHTHLSHMARRYNTLSSITIFLNGGVGSANVAGAWHKRRIADQIVWSVRALPSLAAQPDALWTWRHYFSDGAGEPSSHHSPSASPPQPPYNRPWSHAEPSLGLPSSHPSRGLHVSVQSPSRCLTARLREAAARACRMSAVAACSARRRALPPSCTTTAPPTKAVKSAHRAFEFHPALAPPLIHSGVPLPAFSSGLFTGLHRLRVPRLRLLLRVRQRRRVGHPVLVARRLVRECRGRRQRRPRGCRAAVARRMGVCALGRLARRAGALPLAVDRELRRRSCQHPRAPSIRLRERRAPAREGGRGRRARSPLHGAALEVHIFSIRSSLVLSGPLRSSLILSDPL